MCINKLQFTGDVHDVASSAKQKKLKVGSATPKISEVIGLK